MGDPADRRF